MIELAEYNVISVPQTQYFDSNEPLNGRIVSIHWDMIPWGIVFTLEIPEAESENARHYKTPF